MFSSADYMYATLFLRHNGFNTDQYQYATIRYGKISFEVLSYIQGSCKLLYDLKKMVVNTTYMKTKSIFHNGFPQVLSTGYS